MQSVLETGSGNNNYKTLKMTKLLKFGLSIHISESQIDQQLLRDFEDDKITEIRTVHTHFWKPNSNNY